MSKMLNMTFILRGTGDPSVGISDYFQEITITSKYEEWLDEDNQDARDDFIKDMKKLLEDYFLCDCGSPSVMTKEEFEQELEEERKFEEHMRHLDEEWEKARAEFKGDEWDDNCLPRFRDVDKDYFREKNRRTLSRINGAGVRC